MQALLDYLLEIIRSKAAIISAYKTALLAFGIGVFVQYWLNYLYYYIKTEDIRASNTSKAAVAAAIEDYLATRPIRPSLIYVINSTTYAPLFIICIMYIDLLSNTSLKIIMVLFLMAISSIYFTIGRSFFSKVWMSGSLTLVWFISFVLFLI